jgi:hypothetical protein
VLATGHPTIADESEALAIIQSAAAPSRRSGFPITARNVFASRRICDAKKILRPTYCHLDLRDHLNLDVVDRTCLPVVFELPVGRQCELAV